MKINILNKKPLKKWQKHGRVGGEIKSVAIKFAYFKVIFPLSLFLPLFACSCSTFQSGRKNTKSLWMEEKKYNQFS